jgi:catechol 2,3-dioxygenase-like lactoylglutathione lyase family enzyme
LRVEQVDFVTVPTRDVERAITFYRDALGLPAGAQGEVETPNVTHSFWSPERDGESFQPDAAGIAFRVADTGVCQMGFCKDPDGNSVILHRRYATRG